MFFSKLTTTIVSTFTSYYVFLWSKYFPEKPLTPPLPSFDGRAVCYPSDLNLRDYMSWRQVDCKQPLFLASSVIITTECTMFRRPHVIVQLVMNAANYITPGHINNLYNTTFWTLVQQGGMDARSAEQRLSGTVSSDKNELLFKEFGINYNKEPECFKKGTVLYRDVCLDSVEMTALYLTTLVLSICIHRSLVFAYFISISVSIFSSASTATALSSFHHNPAS